MVGGIVLELSAAGSRIIVAPGALDNVGEFIRETIQPHRFAIITDSNVGPLYATRAARALGADAPVVLTMPAGEEHKTRETWGRLSDELLAHGVGRDGAIVALGGGVVGDVAGFVAATYLRGIPVVQVPTSLVAMLDASIGGKTGVDVPAGKNLIGAFHGPAVIVVDPLLLATLPSREVRGGLAEALKHGVIADPPYFAFVARQAPELRDPANAASNAMRELVERSVAIKCEIVNEDPREAGRRKVLNFGHTLGHAIEAASGYSLRHGEAIAAGMALEARLGERLGVTEAGTATAVERALLAAGLSARTSLDSADIIRRTHGDKKKANDRIHYALPTALGRFNQWTTAVDDADVAAVLGQRGSIG